jgi:hypothetical protein
MNNNFITRGISVGFILLGLWYLFGIAIIDSFTATCVSIAAFCIVIADFCDYKYERLLGEKSIDVKHRRKWLLYKVICQIIGSVFIIAFPFLEIDLPSEIQTRISNTVMFVGIGITLLLIDIKGNEKNEEYLDTVINLHSQNEILHTENKKFLKEVTDINKEQQAMMIKINEKMNEIEKASEN